MPKMPQIASPDPLFVKKIFRGGACPRTPLEAHALQALAIHPLPTLKIWLTTSKSLGTLLVHFMLLPKRRAWIGP